ncbi:hypothetical protein DBT_0013 [Dissulfuribacter thermophilus]|uniref:DUF948 domain-containing protein n=1 Tax=Dissulfuribacter thermophilus TaxID=1156395 RepID=A0A1B9F8E6_9BACT|nr:DUF948 domain-containing protein [Dissulfuribacter thermophilus]OCC16196.1 hypothetical protein DBT_0013 [Dissulfuribacter thermophilus]
MPIQAAVTVGLIAFIVLVAFLIFAIIKVKNFLENAQLALNKVTDILDDARSEVKSLTDKAENLLDTINNEISTLEKRIDIIQTEISGTIQEVNLTLQSSRELEKTVQETVKGLEPILSNAQNITKDLELLSYDIRKKVGQTSDFFNAAEDAAKTVRSVTGIVRSGLSGVAIEVASLATGAKATIQYLTKKIEKGGK